MTGAVDPGAWLQAGSTVFVAIVGVAVGFFVRRTSATSQAIDKSHEETTERIKGLERRIDGLYDDTSATRADVAQIKGYLAAVQGDHFALRTPAAGRRGLEPIEREP